MFLVVSPKTKTSDSLIDTGMMSWDAPKEPQQKESALDLDWGAPVTNSVATDDFELKVCEKKILIN